MFRVAVLTAGLLLPLVGCHPQHLAPAARPEAAQLATTSRVPLDPDISDVPREPAASPPVRPVAYRRLTAAECRSLAIKHAPLAADLDTHPNNDPPTHHLLKKRPELARLSRLVRGYAADEIRNRCAADALELYFTLAASEGQFDQAAAAHGILRAQLASAELVVKGGLKDRADTGAIRRRLLELESQMAKLDAGIAALNAGLAVRLGLDPADHTPIWPADPLRVRGDDVDVAAAVSQGLHYRPDLNLLRTLTSRDDFGGELANAVLTGVNPLLGTATASNPIVVAVVGLLKKEPTRAEATVQRQLLGLLAAREQQADGEIRAAAASVRGERAAVAAKAAEVRSHAARVVDLEKRDELGQQVAAELATARLDLFKARGELIQAAANWHIAEVKLRQATGLLVRE